jgi:hypothetical protein
MKAREQRHHTNIVMNSQIVSEIRYCRLPRALWIKEHHQKRVRDGFLAGL